MHRYDTEIIVFKPGQTTVAFLNCKTFIVSKLQRSEVDFSQTFILTLCLSAFIYCCITFKSYNQASESQIRCTHFFLAKFSKSSEFCMKPSNCCTNFCFIGILSSRKPSMRLQEERQVVQSEMEVRLVAEWHHRKR